MLALRAIAKHRFYIAVMEDGVMVGARCTRCGQAALFEGGQLAEEVLEQDCIPRPNKAPKVKETSENPE